MSASFEAVLLDIVEGLEEADLEYALVGGVAVLAWGDPRTTRDIDVIARLTPADLDRLSAVLGPRGLDFDTPGAKTAIQEGSHFTIFHEDGFYHVDMVAANEPSHEWTLEGRQRAKIQEQECWIASPEATVANKLVFGSEQDLQDAAGILARLDEDLDEARLAKLCERLNVRDAYDELRAEIDLAGEG